MLVNKIAFTFTALLYPRHTIRYPKLMPWKVDSCGKGEMFSDVTLAVCKHFTPFFNIVNACLSRKCAIDLHLTESRESL